MVSIDVLYGFGQELVTGAESRNLAIENLFIKDYPIKDYPIMVRLTQ